MTAHPGYDTHATEGRNRANSRNGRTRKRVKTGTAELEIEVPRDRAGTFEPWLVPKRRRRLDGFDDKVLALDARGRSRGHLTDLNGVRVSTFAGNRALEADAAPSAGPPATFAGNRALEADAAPSAGPPATPVEACRTWDEVTPLISRLWRTHWAHLIPFFDLPPEIRKVIYTTNAIESISGPAPQGHQDARGLPHAHVRPQKCATLRS